MGFGNPLVDVNFARSSSGSRRTTCSAGSSAPSRVPASRTMALGSLVMPVLIDWSGCGRGLGPGLAVSAAGVAWLPAAASLDRELAVPAGVPLLQAIPMFAPLTPVTSRRWPASWPGSRCRPASVIVREGEESDRFFVIESGTVAVTPRTGASSGTRAPGDYFGEIGLLRDVPRTATITAEPTPSSRCSSARTSSRP